MGKDAAFYAGWHSHQMCFIMHVYVEHHKQEFVNQYLSSLRPEIAAEMVRDATALFPPGVAQLVSQFKEEWDGAQ